MPHVLFENQGRFDRITCEVAWDGKVTFFYFFKQCISLTRAGKSSWAIGHQNQQIPKKKRIALFLGTIFLFEVSSSRRLPMSYVMVHNTTYYSVYWIWVKPVYWTMRCIQIQLHAAKCFNISLSKTVWESVWMANPSPLQLGKARTQVMRK